MVGSHQMNLTGPPNTRQGIRRFGRGGLPSRSETRYSVRFQQDTLAIQVMDVIDRADGLGDHAAELRQRIGRRPARRYPSLTARYAFICC